MPKRPTTTPEQEGIEFRPDGWERFKAAVHAAGKTGSARQPAARKKAPASASTGSSKRRSKT